MQRNNVYPLLQAELNIFPGNYKVAPYDHFSRNCRSLATTEKILRPTLHI